MKEEITTKIFKGKMVDVPKPKKLTKFGFKSYYNTNSEGITEEITYLRLDFEPKLAPKEIKIYIGVPEKKYQKMVEMLTKKENLDRFYKQHIKGKYRKLKINKP
jgi:KTSC domain